MLGWNVDLGLDLGTCQTRVYQRGVGLVSIEPSVVAFSPGHGEVVAVGSEAKLIADQGSTDVRVVFPLRGGVVADHHAAAEMTRLLLRLGELAAAISSSPSRRLPHYRLYSGRTRGSAPRGAECGCAPGATGRQHARGRRRRRARAH